MHGSFGTVFLDIISKFSSSLYLLIISLTLYIRSYQRTFLTSRQRIGGDNSRWKTWLLESHGKGFRLNFGVMAWRLREFRRWRIICFVWNGIVGTCSFCLIETKFEPGHVKKISSGQFHRYVFLFTMVACRRLARRTSQPLDECRPNAKAAPATRATRTKMAR